MIPVTVQTASRRTAVIILGMIALAPAAHGQAGFRPRFLPQPPFAVGIGVDPGRQAMALADLNDDQRPDLVAIEPDEARVAIRLNDGNGGFGAATEIDLDGAVPTAVAVTDVTSPLDTPAAGAPDGKPDLLIGDDFGEVIVVPGHGDGTFPSGENQLLELDDISEVVGLAVGNFDAAAGVDVAVLDVDGVLVLCNDGGSLAPCPNGERIEAGSDSIEIVSGDFNGDAKADLAVLDRSDQRVLPMNGNGDGSFDLGTAINVAGEASGAESIDMAVARIDEDNLDDLVIANRNELLQFIAVTLLGSTRGVFRNLAFVIDFDASALAVGDFDNGDDHVNDVLVGYSGGTRGGVTINLGDPGGSFADPFIPVGTNTLGPVTLMLAADLNGDGIVDVLAARDDGASARVLLNGTLPFCSGDCNADGNVSIDELMRGVGILLGERDARDCIALDADATLTVTVNELIAAVNRALEGCPTS